jgi:hypothetical protein
MGLKMYKIPSFCGHPTYQGFGRELSRTGGRGDRSRNGLKEKFTDSSDSALGKSSEENFSQCPQDERKKT